MSTSNAVDPAGPKAATSLVPIIIDLGKIGRKKAKELKKGEGPYLDEVEPAIAQIKAELGAKVAGKEILPIVVLYEKKPRKVFPGLPSFRLP